MRSAADNASSAFSGWDSRCKTSASEHRRLKQGVRLQHHSQMSGSLAVARLGRRLIVSRQNDVANLGVDARDRHSGNGRNGTCATPSQQRGEHRDRNRHSLFHKR